MRRVLSDHQGHSVRGLHAASSRPAGHTPPHCDYEMAGHVCACTRSVASDSATPWAAARQAPLSSEFTKQEYWSGLPFPASGDLPDPGIEPASPVAPVAPALAGEFVTSEPLGKPEMARVTCKSSIFLSFLSRWRFPSLRE